MRTCACTYQPIPISHRVYSYSTTGTLCYLCTSTRTPYPYLYLRYEYLSRYLPEGPDIVLENFFYQAPGGGSQAHCQFFPPLLVSGEPVVAVNGPPGQHSVHNAVSCQNRSSLIRKNKSSLTGKFWADKSGYEEDQN